MLAYLSIFFLLESAPKLSHVPGGTLPALKDVVVTIVAAKQAVSTGCTVSEMVLGWMRVGELSEELHGGSGLGVCTGGGSAAGSSHVVEGGHAVMIGHVRVSSARRRRWEVGWSDGIVGLIVE